MQEESRIAEVNLCLSGPGLAASVVVMGFYRLAKEMETTDVARHGTMTGHGTYS